MPNKSAVKTSHYYPVSLNRRTRKCFTKGQK